MLRIIPYASVHFGLYEYYRRLLVQVHHPSSGGSMPIVSPVLDLLAGSCAGATAVVFTYPLDLVRTRLAFMTEERSVSSMTSTTTRSSTTAITSSASSWARPSVVGRWPSITGVLTTTLRNEGVRGLYHGVGPSMYGILPYAGLKFYVYQVLKQRWQRQHASAQSFGLQARGDAAGAASPGKAHPTRLPIPWMLAYGASAGLVAQTVTYPFDVVRRRMQIEGLLSDPVNVGGSLPQARLPKSTPAALLSIVRQHGWRALYAGLSINYLKASTSCV